MASGDNSGLSYTNVITLGVVLSFLVQKGYSLHCWECNSKYDPNCGEPFKNQTIALVDCGQRFLPHHPNVPGKICRKITQKVRNDYRVIRSCGYLEPNEAAECVNRAGTHQVFMQYCQCGGTDGCNTAGTLYVINPILALAAAITAAVM